MGTGQHPNDSVTLAQTRGACQRAHGSHQGVVGLLVPGGAGLETQLVPLGLRPSDIDGGLSAPEGTSGLARSGRFVARVGGQGSVRPFDMARVIFEPSHATGTAGFGVRFHGCALAELMPQFDAEG